MGEQDESESTKNIKPQKAPTTGGEGGGKKDGEPITAVLKLDLHCQGCAEKVKRSVRHFEGIEKVKADFAAKKLTVVGYVDPAVLRERVEYKTKKKVELLSPQPKKDGGAVKKTAEEEKPDKKKEEDKKPKEAVVSTAAMKMRLHCDGCANKIKRLINKYIDGVNSVSTDLQKDLVTVVGTMNGKEVASLLKEKLKRAVEIVPPKKDDAGGDKKQNEPAVAVHAGGSGDEHKKKEGHGEDEKQKDGIGADEKAKAVSVGGGDDGNKVKVSKMGFQRYAPNTYYVDMPMYDQIYPNQDYGLSMFQHQHHPGPSAAGYVAHYMNGSPPPTPILYDQMFSDENPNACFVM